MPKFTISLFIPKIMFHKKKTQENFDALDEFENYFVNLVNTSEDNKVVDASPSRINQTRAINQTEMTNQPTERITDARILNGKTSQIYHRMKKHQIDLLSTFQKFQLRDVEK